MDGGGKHRRRSGEANASFGHAIQGAFTGGLDHGLGKGGEPNMLNCGFYVSAIRHADECGMGRVRVSMITKRSDVPERIAKCGFDFVVCRSRSLSV